MINEDKIELLVREHIKKEENLGHSSGGSGHLSFKSFEIDRIYPKEKHEEGWRVCYEYTIYVETEFTYYPDNPPYEDKKSGFIILT